MCLSYSPVLTWGPLLSKTSLYLSEKEYIDPQTLKNYQLPIIYRRVVVPLKTRRCLFITSLRLMGPVMFSTNEVYGLCASKV